MKIYTKTGDTGQTSLYDGSRVAKDDARIEAIGSLDELNSLLGLIVARMLPDSDTRDKLIRIQQELFTLGSELATPEAAKNKSGIKHLSIKSHHVEKLEKEIDQWQKDLPALTHFILPGGSEAGAIIHHARTVCRRVERRMLGVFDGARQSQKYINRLSDWLFMLARKINSDLNIAEIIWNTDEQ